MKFMTDDVITILKWVITILITGFIAQFGKKLANYIIDKTRERRQKRASGEQVPKEIPQKRDHSKFQDPPSTGEDVPQSTADAEKERLKAEKKIQKERAKQLKKMAKAKEKAEKKQNSE